MKVFIFLSRILITELVKPKKKYNEDSSNEDYN